MPKLECLTRKPEPTATQPARAIPVTLSQLARVHLQIPQPALRLSLRRSKRVVTSVTIARRS